MANLAQLSAAAFGILVCVEWYRRRSHFLRLPPGPPRLPVVGNATNLPASQQWLTYSKWTAKYGDLIGFVVLGQPIVVIHSAQAAFELLDRRGSIYSDRPGFALMQKWGGWDWMITPMHANEAWKLQRKMFAQHLNPKSVQQFRDVLHTQAENLAQRLIVTPHKFQDHTRLFAGANIMMVTYGYEVADEDDEWIKLARDANASLDALTNVGAHPVDIFPWLHHLPMELFGRAFAAQMRHMRNLAEQLVTRPYNAVKEEVFSGRVSQLSMAHKLIKAHASNGVIQLEDSIRHAMAGMYVAGADTIISSLDTAILALMLHPNVQKEGQKAIDGLIGDQRLPSLEDRSELPYIDAVLRETLRGVLKWNPVAPLAIPHRLTRADSYRQWEFPAGTTVISNSWHMLHDETVYPNASMFTPHRFINANGTLRDDILDPREIAFGFGRRACPGRYLAEESLWIAIATIIYLFDLSIPTDEKGEPIHPEVKYESAVISRPTPFQCVFTPRSHAAALMGSLKEA